MTHVLDAAEVAAITLRASDLKAHTDIALPEDTKKSRLQKPPRPVEPLDDVATAGDRIEAFWKKFPDGNILTKIDNVLDLGGGVLIYTMRAYVRKNADTDTPDATAYATRSTADPDEVTASFPQETAETSAISRALRNLGILATPKKPRAPRKAAS